MEANKERITVWLTPNTRDLVNSFYKLDDCPTKSVFIERAIRFYSGYVASGKTEDYMITAINDSIKRTIGSFENRMAKMLFKYSVEEAMMMNVVAAYHKVDKPQLDLIRGQCIEEIRRTNGKFSFSDAVIWQRGGDD